MNELALVTGASSGIGRGFAELLARKGKDLIVAARRLPELEALKAELEAAHGVTVTPVACDLGTDDGVATLLAAVEGKPLDILINNAGFGGQGAFLDRSLPGDLAMVDLNIRSVMALCHGIAPGMVARGRGRILNVGSTAGMVPGPMQATYYASKAFVNSFSQALAEELRQTGVTVTLLAPGAVETPFMERADLRGTQLAARGKSVGQVVQVGYDAMRQGKLVVVNETLLAIVLRFIVPFAPRGLVLRTVARLQAK
ncbi:SDR family oxidoreductase [Jannaschia sp. M317]|uniref:SDR family NAD(P)-dependent oxidoreductase n=1 Tax=Jannaschia sp. M317 TaxID=2867011 RepID=UPI0021A94C47|nr:SDR family oxidoreductase [Jannaschia sp. M317]UWQ19140.1 SDR family oxidoreductase [Jannaschia sp. M317]